ncbi:MAG: pyridoxal-phosphate dependent enzyme [Myxococcales bacterium]|nr:pyridoxal-phosphate dependent enzyme [Myxococcales bacterium]
MLARGSDTSRLQFPRSDEENPFLRYRSLLYSHRVAIDAGMRDEDYCALIDRLDRAVSAVDGRGFRVTPYRRRSTLSDDLGFRADGGIWVKDETGSVSGSHEGRHPMGIVIHLEVLAALGRRDPSADRLAITGSGNAALAAAVVARAAGRPLEVFIAPDAAPAAIARLREFGAHLTFCARLPLDKGGSPGDPCAQRFRAAVDGGAIPVAPDGSENGLAIEGGRTLGYELVDELARSGARLDRLFVQVGGALASACVQALAEAEKVGALARMPRIHAVQTRGAWPLARAYDKVVRRILQRLAGAPDRPTLPSDEQMRADLIHRNAGSPTVQWELAYAAHHRSEFMTPWQDEPKSVAEGLVDVETGDWLAIVRAMIQTGGYPVVVSEPYLEEANRIARQATRIDVDHTGSAGLGGVLSLRRMASFSSDEKAAVIFSGIRR